MWDFFSNVLFGWWWHGEEGRTKTADAADNFALPVLMLVGVGCLVALLVYWATL